MKKSSLQAMGPVTGDWGLALERHSNMFIDMVAWGNEARVWWALCYSGVWGTKPAEGSEVANVKSAVVLLS